MTDSSNLLQLKTKRQVLTGYQLLLIRYRKQGLRRLLFGGSSSKVSYLLLSVFLLSLIGFLGVDYFQKQTSELDKSMRKYQLVRSVFADELGSEKAIYFNEEVVAAASEATHVSGHQDSKQEKSVFTMDSHPSSAIQDAVPAYSRVSALTGSKELLLSSQATGGLQVTKKRQNSNVMSAYRALYQGDLNRANREFIEVIGLEPSNIYALNGLASTQSKLGVDSQALITYQKVLAIDPSNLHAFEAVLTSYSNSLGVAEWKDRVKSVLEAHPKSVVLNSVLASFYARESDWLAAQKLYFKAHALDSQNASYSFNLAVSLDHLGQYRLAKQYYTLALEQASGQALNFDRSELKQRLRTIEQFIEQSD